MNNKLRYILLVLTLLLVFSAAACQPGEEEATSTVEQTSATKKTSVGKICSWKIPD